MELQYTQIRSDRKHLPEPARLKVCSGLARNDS